MLNVLFTSVGRRVELVRAFRSAYHKLALAGKIVALDIDPLAPALHVADRPIIVPRLDASDYLSTVIAICERERIGLVLPLIDPDIPFLAQHRAAIEATGARLAVVSVEAAALTADKWRTTTFFRGLGLATPASWTRDDFEPAMATYPLFIKPRRGSASQHTFRLNNAHEAEFFLDYVPDPIIQEFIEGPEITTDAACDLDGRLLGLVSRRRIAVRSGEVTKGTTVYDPDLATACARIASALPAVGPITIQCIMRDGVPVFTEINARLGGGVPLAIAAGVDIPGLLLASTAGLPVALPGESAYRTGIYMTRFDESFFLEESEHEAMARNRLRS